MTFLNRMRISGKVSVIIAMYVLLSCSVVVITGETIRTTFDAVLAVDQQSQQGIDFRDRILRSSANAQVEMMGILGSGKADPAALKVIEGTAKQLPAIVEQMRTAGNFNHAELTDKILVAAIDFATASSEFAGDIRAGRLDDARAVSVAKVLPAYRRERASNGALAAALTKENRTHTINMAVHGGQVMGMTALATLLGLALVSLAAVLLLQRGISRPLKTITDALGRLAAGDMEVTVKEDLRRKDEVGELANAFIAFRQAAVDKRQAEAEAAEHRRVAEAQQGEHDKMRQAIASDQALVVNALADGLTQLAAGDLVFRLETAFPPSYEKLRQDFNEAMDRLQDAMTTISSAALGISAGADEISRSATDLSQRTEQQAASLEETAAALDQITTAVRRTAEGAAEVNEVVAGASADAAASSQVVRDTIAAISQIQQSAHQVAQIIGVIDEIAFQTNLLALNAGVEAARAGEAGRGFAVVATEVRALAQRSAVAAKEIKTLISTSTGQVDTGVKLVVETGSALERIQTSVAEIHNLISGIAGAAREQASGMDEVNNAVDQMDRITQQNASVVEESTAASLALAEESQQLTTLIARFGIGEDRRAAHPSAVPRPTDTAADERRRAPAFRRSSGSAALKLDDWQEF